jgi:ABC-type antimicrobial peptide transport system permease subunit
MALGASRRDVLGMVSRQSLALVGTGVVLGLTAAALVTRLLAAFLLGTQPLDPLTFIGAPLLLVATAFVATYLPARRATRVDPMVALRAE